jgi:hypothetical protein
MIVRPEDYLLAVSRSDLRILHSALLCWKGPYRSFNGLPRTPLEEEHERDSVKRAAVISNEIGKILDLEV